MKPSAVSIARKGSDRGYESQLSCFYDGVVSMLRNADSLWIFGPGNAKIQFKIPLDRQEQDDRSAGVKTVVKKAGCQYPVGSPGKPAQKERNIRWHKDRNNSLRGV